ncbi:MAG: methyltransferase domain-containing protein [Rhodovibrionaceae bacterium]
MPETADPLSWPDYYAKTEGRPPRATLLEALNRFDAEGRRGLAIDLGCGSGRDSLEILKRGWELLAIDREIEGLRRLHDKTACGAKLQTCCNAFEKMSLSPALLINASFALPLVPPEQFRAVWRKVTAAILPGGRFAGQFFGQRDSWNGEKNLTFHDREEVEALLRSFELEMLREEEEDSVTVRGEAKHWHIFHVVARKPELEAGAE